jgi:hypothetical protein
MRLDHPPSRLDRRGGGAPREVVPGPGALREGGGRNAVARGAILALLARRIHGLATPAFAKGIP